MSASHRRVPGGGGHDWSMILARLHNNAPLHLPHACDCQVKRGGMDPGARSQDEKEEEEEEEEGDEGDEGEEKRETQRMSDDAYV